MKHLDPPREPTPEECTTGARIGDHGQAFWWPQMGGYAARAVAVAWPDDCCLDVWVWHDGQFPFGGTCQSCGDARSPVRVHMDDGDGWIRLGEFLNSLDGETS
jgi:hypothetical protein